MEILSYDDFGLFIYYICNVAMYTIHWANLIKELRILLVVFRSSGVIAVIPEVLVIMDRSLLIIDKSVMLTTVEFKISSILSFSISKPAL